MTAVSSFFAHYFNSHYKFPAKIFFTEMFSFPIWNIVPNPELQVL